jgi:hypothetical protein
MRGTETFSNDNKFVEDSQRVEARLTREAVARRAFEERANQGSLEEDARRQAFEQAFEARAIKGSWRRLWQDKTSRPAQTDGPRPKLSNKAS